MEISEHSIKVLYETVTGNNKKSIYRSGPDLIEFFSKYGFEDEYGQGFPARAYYAKEKIEALNGTALLEKVILDMLDPRIYIDSEYDVDEIAEYLNQYLVHDGYKLMKDEYCYKITHLNSNGNILAKNIIFAANGPKPELVLVDTISYEIEITENNEYCLVYNQSIPNGGLTWKVLVEWWSNKESFKGDKDRAFLRRLYSSLDSEPEKFFFRTYYYLYNPKHCFDIPALIPQVYLHYDPKTIKELKGERRLLRQRMDFLLLLSRGDRVVIEIDGKQHYADEGKVSPAKYAEMVKEDRKLKLNGYDVYRFGGFEFQDKEEAVKIIKDFFEKLFEKYKVNINYE